MVLDAIQTDDSLYENGIRYSFVYLEYDSTDDRYRKIYSIDNSHGPAHVHVHGREIPFDGGWKAALQQFEDWVKTHRNMR